MTSKLVVNTIEADTGISSVSFASSISMSSTSKFFFSDAGIDIGADTNINRPASGVLGFNINSSEKARIDSSGHIQVNTTTKGLATYGEDLTIASSDHGGITIRTGTGHKGTVYFSDATSGDGEYKGSIQYDHSDNSLRLAANSSVKLFIKSNGYVGINSASPAYPLDVLEPTDNAGLISVRGSNDGYDTGFSIRNGPNPKWYLINDVNGSGGHSFEIRGDSYSNDRFLTIDQTGDIGLGETNPNRSGYSSPVTSVGYNSGNGYGVLELLGNQTSDNTIANIVAYNVGGSSRLAAIAFERSGANNSGAIRFETYASGSAAERLRITSTGAIGIGTNNPISGAAGARLAVHLDDNTSYAGGTARGNGIIVYNRNAGGHSSLELAQRNSANTYGTVILNAVNPADGNDYGADFTIQTRVTGSGNYGERLRITSDGKVGMQVATPKSNLHVYGPGDIRIGSQYGGHASIAQQVQYSSGYTGVHWMFETNGQMSWCFDGVMIVYGSGGSSYGTEVTHIKLVYSRESGALNSGDTWRNGSSDYNIETLGHGQVGLNPSSGSFSTTEQTDPDGSGSTRSLFKFSWSASGQSVGVWSKLVGNFYWGTGTGGNVEIQDKDGNIVFNSI